MKGRWESNINVWFPFMYFQKWNCAASLFPKQNYNVLSPNSYINISVRDLYIFPGSVGLFAAAKYVDRSWVYINRSQTHECRNWDWGRTIPREGIHKWDLCPFAVYYLRYAVRSFFTMSRISLADGKRAGQKVQHKIAVAVQKVKSPLLYVPLFWNPRKILSRIILFVLVIKLTKETRRRLSRGRD